MEYLMLIQETDEDIASRTNENKEEFFGVWRAYHRAMIDAGVFVDGNMLHPGDTATTVRVRDSERQVQDGPYAATKEQLGGYIVLDLPSLDEALDWAARCPAASTGAVEVRPIASSDVEEQPVAVER